MRKNKVLARLRGGEPSFGLFLTVGSPILAEEVAIAGFDWLVLDAQHGYWSYEALLSAIQVTSHTETVPLVRVLGNDPFLIGQTLDAGALGVIVPMVNTPAEPG